jgi:hypothetical protein
MLKPTQPLNPDPGLAALRREITDLVTRNAVAMVQNAIDAVNDGQYQAVKYLFEVVGLYPTVGDEHEPEEASLAAILLQQLGLQDGSVAERNDDHRGTGNVNDPLQ